jgi:hypothetical protein
MKKLAAALAVVSLSASPALAATHYVKVAPTSVKRGTSVRVYGSVGGGCASSDRVTLISHAFKGATTHEFAGVPAIYAKQDSYHDFSLHVTISKSVKAGRYSVSGRCGGGNFGSVTLRVR